MTEDTTTPIMNKVANEDAADKEPRKEEKLTSIMEAANALTALGDEDEVAPDSSSASVKVDTQDEHADVHPVDKPAEDDPPSIDKAASVAVKEEPKESSSTAAAKTEATVQAAAAAAAEDGTVISANSGGTGTTTTANSMNTKRHLPEHKKPDAAPTFPEKMMALMRFVDQHKNDPNYCAAWLPEGKSFVVRNPDEFARNVIPKYFKATKFSSFTRKLYRWGFRQINRGIGPDDPVIFGNDYFERDNEALMSQMRSITAAGTRKSESRMMGATSHHHNMYGKRPFDGGIHNSGSMYDGYNEQQKRYLYEQFMHQQKSAQMMQQQHNPSMMYGGMSTNGPMHMNHPMHGGNAGPIMDSGYPTPHHMLPQMSGKTYDMMPSMHSDGSSQPMMMMNMGYNPMYQQQLQQQQSHQQLAQQQQQQQQGGAMMPSNLAPSIPGMGTNPTPQHMGQAMGGPMTGPTSPPQQQGGGGGSGSGSIGPTQSGYLSNGGGAVNGGSGNQNPSEIVNAAIRALHYSA